MPQNQPQNPYADLFSVAGKTAVITGGSSGLGLAMAEAYLRAGRPDEALRVLQESDSGKDDAASAARRRRAWRAAAIRRAAA